MRLAAILLLLALSAPARAYDARTHPYDLSPDPLDPGAWEIAAFWGRVTRGLTPDLQVSAHAMGYPAGVLNGFAKWRFLNRSELRASVEAGFVWAALTTLLSESDDAPLVVFLPVELRAAVPLTDSLELHLAAIGRWSMAGSDASALGMSTLRLDVSLLRADLSGAWILWGRFPLVTRASVRLDALLGSSNVGGAMVVDELTSWGVLLARDQRLGERLHLRLGLGYRNTYGILLYESLGHVLVHVEGYWRREAP